jgi:hypothetical protein
MRKKLLFAAVFCCLPCIGWAASRPKTYRKTLDQPTVTQGYSCARGYAWFYADGHLASCTVSIETAFGQARAPAGSWVRLTPDGAPSLLVVRHDTRILDYNCRGGGLGGPEGYTTAFYPSGKLKVCWLAGDQDVQGIPCMGASFFADVFVGGAGVSFHESGKLRTCKLSRDFRSLRRGQHIVQAP